MIESLAAQRAYHQAEARGSRGRLRVCRDFFPYEQLRADPRLDRPADVGTIPLDMLQAWF